MDADMPVDEPTELMEARNYLGAVILHVLKVGMTLSVVFCLLLFLMGLSVGYQQGGIGEAIGVALLLGWLGAIGLGPGFAAIYWGVLMWGREEEAYDAFVIQQRRSGHFQFMPGQYAPDARASLLMLFIQILFSPFTFLRWLWRWWRLASAIKAYARLPHVQEYLTQDKTTLWGRRILVGYLAVGMPGFCLFFLAAIFGQP
ncbi:MAG TPA: hypothetical protein VMZ06_15935 [Candidatus Bathyarchaeia archaeon]|nr:hypothetical protein [Candidatus Bathyarchaeia archaeon]